MDKKIPPHIEAALNEINQNYSGNSAKQQCARFLAALRITNVTTFLAMRFLSIYHAPARAKELRIAGHDLATVWVKQADENGVIHRIGMYVLRGENHAK